MSDFSQETHNKLEEAKKRIAELEVELEKIKKERYSDKSEEASVNLLASQKFKACADVSFIPKN